MRYPGFNKIHEDDEKAIFKNHNGHSITVAKGSLSPKLLHDLNRLPLHAYEGEYVKDPTPGGDFNASTEYGPEDLGAGSTPVSNFTTREMPDSPINRFGRAIKPFAENPIGYTVGTPKEFTPQTEDTQTQQQAIGGTQQEEQASPPPAAAPEPEPAPARTPQQAPEQGQNVDLSNQSTTYQTPEQQDAADFHKSNVEWMQDQVNQHITPATYGDLFARRSTLGKIGTLFSLLLGGAGAGLTGGPNVVLKMMDKELENDLEAQKTSKQNAFNFVQMSKQHELRKAQIGLTGAQAQEAKARAAVDWTTNATNKVYLGLVHSYLAPKVNALPPNSSQRQAGTQLLNAVAQGVDAKVNENIQKGVKAKAILRQNQSQVDPEQAFQQKLQAFTLFPQGQAMAKLMAEHHVPGFAQPASRVVTPEDKDEIAGIKNLKPLYDQAQAYLNKVGKFDPRTELPGPLRGEGRALRQQLIDAARNSQGITRLSPFTEDIATTLVPNLRGTHISGEDQALMNQSIRTFNNHVNTFKTGLWGGLDPQPNNQQENPQQQAPAAEQIKTVGGKRYRRGPKGEAIEIK